MVERVIAAFGRVDVLVNNAGVMHLAPFVETTEAIWRAEMEVNVFGTMRVTRAVLPHMIAQRSGKIVNLSSQLALIGWDRAAVYAGGKGFILTWSKSLAREVGRYNIKACDTQSTDDPLVER
jgi:short-subunit dehydrogenase